MTETTPDDQEMASNAAIRGAKQSLRKVMREKLDLLPAELIREQCASSLVNG